MANRPFVSVFHRALRLVTASILGTFLVVTATNAADLDQARNAGVVGERPDGLVGAISSTIAPDLKALIEMVNRERLSTYRELAEKEGLKLDAVQTVAGERQLQKARSSGWYWMDSSGAWRKG